MTRIMYDAIYPKNIPANAQIVASYIDGKWPNYSQAVALFPEALHVSIAVFPESDAMALDVEQYDATPQQAPGWAARQRKRGYAHPIVYMSAAAWPQVRSEFHKQGVPEPLYWVADYDGVRSIPDGAIAKQFQGTTAPGFDLSVVADYVPGLDREDMALDPKDPIVVGILDKLNAVASLDQTLAQIQIWGDATHPDSIHSIGQGLNALRAQVDALAASVKAGGTDPQALAKAIVAHMDLVAK